MDHIKRLPDTEVLKNLLEGKEGDVWREFYSDADAIVGTKEAMDYLKAQVPSWSNKIASYEQG